MTATLSKTFEYAPSFNMDTAIFDDHREFYNCYQRKYQLDANSSNLAKYANGEVYSASSEYSAREMPFTMYADGAVRMMASEHPEKRGRYTFGGYDFSIISTTNCRYSAIAMRHMHVIGHPSIKVTAAALSMMQDGETTEGATLLVDHVNDRVYSARFFYEKEEQSFEGVNLKELWQHVPKDREGYRTVMYATSPTGRLVAGRTIRVTQPVRQATAYKDAVAACVVWYQMQGSLPLSNYRAAEAVVRGDRSLANINTRVSVTDVETKGFVNLTPYERARVAVNNAKAKMPRKQYNIYRLGFNSEAFFEEIRKITAPKNETQTVPAFES